MGWVMFYVGMMVGTFLGIAIMCLLAYAKDPVDFQEHEGAILGSPRKL